MTTLCVFARAPLPGKCKTRLATVLGEAQAAGLYRALLEDTLANLSVIADARRVLLAAPEHDGVAVLSALAPPGWDVVPQASGDLTARLIAAFGLDEQVLCLGSDAPLVPVDAVHIALADTEHDVVVGPTRDGGYWAIGMRGVRSELLTDMPWSSDRVTAETLRRCNTLGLTVRLLPESFDVDEGADLDVLAEALHRPGSRAPRTASWLAGCRPG